MEEEGDMPLLVLAAPPSYPGVADSAPGWWWGGWQQVGTGKRQEAVSKVVG